MTTTAQADSTTQEMKSTMTEKAEEYQTKEIVYDTSARQSEAVLNTKEIVAGTEQVEKAYKASVHEQLGQIIEIAESHTFESIEQPESTTTPIQDTISAETTILEATDLIQGQIVTPLIEEAIVKQPPVPADIALPEGKSTNSEQIESQKTISTVEHLRNHTELKSIVDDDVQTTEQVIEDKVEPSIGITDEVIFTNKIITEEEMPVEKEREHFLETSFPIEISDKSAPKVPVAGHQTDGTITELNSQCLPSIKDKIPLLTEEKDISDKVASVEEIIEEKTKVLVPSIEEIMSEDKMIREKVPIVEEQPTLSPDTTFTVEEDIENKFETKFIEDKTRTTEDETVIQEQISMATVPREETPRAEEIVADMLTIMPKEYAQPIDKALSLVEHTIREEIVEENVSQIPEEEQKAIEEVDTVGEIIGTAAVIEETLKASSESTDEKASTVK